MHVAYVRQGRKVMVTVMVMIITAAILNVRHRSKIPRKNTAGIAIHVKRVRVFCRFPLHANTAVFFFSTVCPDACGQRSCDDKLKCCDESCLGSCDISDPTNCSVCLKLTDGHSNTRRCVEKCPDHLYMFEERRCITSNECWNISMPFNIGGDEVKNPFIPFNGTCSLTCPTTFSPDGTTGKRTCKSCHGECKKECHGSTVDSISGAQSYRGCAKISGTMIIQIRQGGRKLMNSLVSLTIS